MPGQKKTCFSAAREVIEPDGTTRIEKQVAADQVAFLAIEDEHEQVIEEQVPE